MGIEEGAGLIRVLRGLNLLPRAALFRLRRDLRDWNDEHPTAGIVPER